MKNLGWVKNSDALEKHLVDNKAFKRDVKKAVGWVTPYVPLVGLLSGGITIGAHVVNKKLNPDDLPKPDVNSEKE